jgi:hypothetical protein
MMSQTTLAVLTYKMMTVSKSVSSISAAAHSMVTKVLSRRQTEWSVKSSTHLRLVPRLRIGTAAPTQLYLLCHTSSKGQDCGTE